MKEPFEPDRLPLEGLDYARLIGPASEARAALAEYNALLSRLENPGLMLSPLTTKEAVFSSKIEGTQATLEDVLEFDAGGEATGERRADIQEIVNYRAAMLQAYEHLQEMPINLWLIRQMHQTLMNSTRGKNKAPGKFRDRQNWIGPPGSTKIEDATYVPPDPTQIVGHLENWERYLAYEDREPLIQTAIVHAQFEIIHPFLDGNGRMGRLLIALYLYQRKLLSYPMFYISGYLERHREEYYHFLRAISDQQDWNSWIEFFLIGVSVQASKNETSLVRIELLRRRTLEQVTELTRSANAPKIVQAIFTQPLFLVDDLARLSGLNRQTTANHVRRLKEAGILAVDRHAAGSRPERLAFTELLGLISKEPDDPTE